MNLNSYGTSKPFSWSHEYLVKIVTAGREPILDDPIQINAFRAIKRGDFVPVRQGDFAYLDKEIDIGYGEKLSRPTLCARMLAILNPKVGGKYLDLGGGTGYFAMLLGKAIGNTGQVFSLERVQWLWESARASQTHYPEIKNVKFLYRNGSEGLKEQAPFDGIHVSFDLSPDHNNHIYNLLKEQLKIRTGILIYPRGNEIKVIQRLDIDEYMEETLPGDAFQPFQSGLD